MKRLSIYKNILISYLLIVFIPLIVFECFLINNVRQNYRQQILNQREADLTQSMEILDTHLRECRSVGGKLSTNILISKYTMHQSVYDNYQAIKALELIRGSNELFMDVIVYYFGDGFVTTADGKVEFDMPERMYTMTEEETRRFWQMLSTSDSEGLKVIRTSWRMFYCIPIPLGTGRAYGTAVFVLDDSVMRELFPQSFSEDGIISFLFSGHDLISTNLRYGEEIPDDVLSAALQQNSVKWNGREYYVQRRGSTVNPSCSMVILSSATALYPSLKNYTPVLVLSLLLVMGCVTLATWLGMRIWMPIRELSQLLVREKEEETHWDNLKNAVQDTLAQKTQVEEALEDYYQIMRENLLLRLLHGKPEDSLSEEITRVGLPENCECGCVLVICLSNPIYTEVVLVELERFGNCISVVEVSDAKRIVIGVFARSEGEAEETVKSLEYIIPERLRQQGTSQCHIGIGRILALKQMWLSYVQAMAVVRRNVNEKFSIVRIGDVLTNSSILPEIHEKSMIFEFSLSQGNRELATRLADEMLEYALNNASVYQYTRYSLINSLMKVRKEDDGARDARNEEAIEQWNGFNMNEMIDETDSDAFRTYLKEMIERQCVYVERISQIREDRYTRAVEDYIRRNCMDKNFSLDSLAEEFGSNATYWSRFIKEKIGQGFSDYVWQLRLEKAKKLLIEEDIAVKDVVERVGFLDPRSFIRKFKNSEGVTPGQYKVMYGMQTKRMEGERFYENENEDVSQ